MTSRTTRDGLQAKQEPPRKIKQAYRRGTAPELSMTSERRAANGFPKQEGRGRRTVKSIDRVRPDPGPGRAFFGACGCFGATEYNRLGKVAGADGGAGALSCCGGQPYHYYVTPVRTRRYDIKNVLNIIIPYAIFYTSLFKLYLYEVWNRHIYSSTSTFIASAPIASSKLTLLNIPSLWRRYIPLYSPHLRSSIFRE